MCDRGDVRVSPFLTSLQGLHEVGGGLNLGGDDLADDAVVDRLQGADVVPGELGDRVQGDVVEESCGLG
jgi:hypothetical protein